MIWSKRLHDKDLKSQHLSFLAVPSIHYIMFILLLLLIPNSPFHKPFAESRLRLIKF
jgi:hypothetical protein